MKSYHKELWLNIQKRMDFINITPEVEQAVIESGIKEGLCLVNAMHITASVFINDDEQGLHRDYKSWLEELAPHEPLSRYDHNLTGEDNGDAHHTCIHIIYFSCSKLIMIFIIKNTRKTFLVYDRF